MAYNLQCNDFLTEFITEDLHTEVLRGNNSCITANQWKLVSSTFPPVWLSGNKPVLAELQLSFGLWCVQEDGAVGGQDLPGLGGGQLASGPHQAHAISFPQGQDQTEGHRASAAAATTSWAPVLTSHRPPWALQPLDTAVRHGQDSLYSVTMLCSQQSWNQVSAIQRYSEDPCRDEKGKQFGKINNVCNVCWIQSDVY